MAGHRPLRSIPRSAVRAAAASSVRHSWHVTRRRVSGASSSACRSTPWAPQRSRPLSARPSRCASSGTPTLSAAAWESASSPSPPPEQPPPQVRYCENWVSCALLDAGCATLGEQAHARRHTACPPGSAFTPPRRAPPPPQHLETSVDEPATIDAGGLHACRLAGRQLSLDSLHIVTEYVDGTCRRVRVSPGEDWRPCVDAPAHFTTQAARSTA